MIWVDQIAQKQKNKTHHIDDMFTPSGFAHIGSLRGPLLHDVVNRVLKESNKETIFTYIFNDFDCIDGLPTDLEKKFSKYLGCPLRLVPSPDKKYGSFAEYFSEDFKKVLEALGVKTAYFSSWDMYHQGKFNEVIKTALDNSKKILEVYKNVAGYGKKSSNWFPLQVICPKCGKLGTTKVIGWDGKEVEFSCEKKMVTWAEGCEHKGKISPFNGNGKLPWKVDWPAHWKVLNITFEGAGKDHASKGGSYDIAFELCKNVFNYPKPFYFPYEFFLFGGKKMSSSKGVGLKARDLTSVLPPEIARFLIVRIPPQKTLEFNPIGDSIPNLFDEYDRCLNAYFLKLENKLPKDKAGEVALDFARIIKLSEIKPLPKKRLFIGRFRTISNLIQNNKTNILDFFQKQKQSQLNNDETELIQERIKYAKIYLEKYAQENTNKLEIKTFIPSDSQKKFLLQSFNRLKSISNKDDKDLIQQTVFECIKSEGIKPKEAFEGIYQTLTRKSFGPKIGELIINIGFDKSLNLLKMDNQNKATATVTDKHLYPEFNDKKVFSIDESVAQKYPSINIGIAVIKNINIKKSDPKLTEEINQFVQSQSHLSNEVISSYPEVLTYRKLYKEMGVDWHSRRPSPEALLRRISQKKDLYQINTCVDAYNLIVMKNRVSVGAFDYDKFHFPTIMRFPKVDEEILLLGDKEPTKFKPIELAYFDQLGGYNIDFNYRDAQRTAVTENTKDILLNIDGINDIDRKKVEKSLQESIDIVLKYCGGTVEFAGVVLATQK
jgi:lysyl-tRNA synthetase class 1